jgi:hypothetical protein
LRKCFLQFAVHGNERALAIERESDEFTVIGRAIALARKKQYIQGGDILFPAAHEIFHFCPPGIARI